MLHVKKVPASLLKHEAGRYLVIGGSVYVFELGVILFAQHMGASPVMAVGLSFWLGVILSFILQKLVTFGDRRMHRQVFLPQVAAYACLVLFNFGFTVLLAKILAPVLPATIIRTIALIITVIWNYYLYRTRIFKSARPDSD